MIIFGLHVADWIVLGLYGAVLIWIGKKTSSNVHGESDFFLAGRKLGGWLQFFLNFGQMTDAASAARTSSIVFSNGVGGVWLNLQTLFMTPYYWFMNAWFRRARLTTVADLFTDRFGGKSLSVLYALSIILFNVANLGASYLVAYKIIEVIVVKPASAYTSSERGSVAEYSELSTLDKGYKRGRLSPAQIERHQYLQRLRDRGDIRPYVSWVKPVPFYLTFTAVIGIYIILGGMRAAALTDAIQGMMIVVFSIVLIPFGISKIGGLQTFYGRLPEHMLDLFGSGAGSEFAWYSVGTILLISFVQIHAIPSNMGVAGSARTEREASIGAVSGGFMKRWMIIAWCFCGLVAYALFGSGGTLSDPDVVWGTLCRRLLGPGFLGLMLVGILAADMASMSSQCLSLSALFVRNIYLNIFPDKTDLDGLFVGRAVIIIALTAGIGTALLMRDIISFMKIGLTFNVAFGATILVIFKWRRVTKIAALVTVIITSLAIVIIPLAVPAIPSLNTLPSLHLSTTEQRTFTQTPATADDVEAGLARAPGEPVRRVSIIPSKPIFFERLIATNPADPMSVVRGEGRFQFELYILSLCDMDVTKMRPAALLAISYTFDSLLPFVLLFSISLLTRETDRARADRFYVKMRTPVVPGAAEDALSLTNSHANARATENLKLFPHSDWEFLRWKTVDIFAFSGCCLFAFLILGVFVLLLRLGH